MLDKLVLKKIANYLELIRFYKPIGFLLLMWPCWFALSILDLNIDVLINWLIVFLFGSFFMRGAGCIINDIIDKDIDKSISRTQMRPLVSKNVTLKEAILILIIFLSISFFILLQFSLPSIIVGIISLPFIIIYPYMKRVTNFPQLFLGVTFSWGVLIVSTEFNRTLTVEFLLLYIACIFWTLAYDTIYAYQDKEDDIKQGVKSTAVYFNEKGRSFVGICYSLVLLIFGYLAWNSSNSLFCVFIMAIFGICTYIAIQKWDINSKSSSNFYFRQNNFFAFMLFIYLLVF